MQLRSRNINGQDHFFYADVEAVLTHSYIMTLAGSHSDRLRNIISAERLYNIPSRRLVEEAPELKAVFTPVRSLDSVLDVADYLRDLLDWLGAAMSGLRPDGNASGFELGAIAYFRSQVDYLARLIEEHSVRMSDRTFLNIFEKVFNSRGLTVNGTPLRGLQILGVLETRALDFDNVVILSMNEGIFPRKQYTRTMIPNSLRRGYGLPDFESLEWTYAYCFYRLMARARKAWLFYDSRADGLGGGEMSRYISQLHYLMPGVDVRFDSLAYGACSSGPRRIMIEKSDDVFDRLRQYFPGGRLRLSASAIKDYRNCPLSFYLKYVCSMRGSDDIVDYISAAQYGNAVHTTIQELISPYAGMVVDKAVLSQFSDPYSASVKDVSYKHLRPHET
ncbi:MAG: PD-(D/E)XK nuclease family protein, partial [Muribaculaceae bacterium]|nr:PD-(D/E)XK nuclease family protein [Muribaculaceae bacterium]